MFVLKLIFFSAIINVAFGCYQCFIDVEDSLRLCWGHILTEYNTRNVDFCFKTLDRIFNDEMRVIEAGKVGRGFDLMLKDILLSEIMPIVEEFDLNTNEDTVYEIRLQAAANNFITEASKLPRASGCFPPCGFQEQGAVYNCMTCQYDSCEFPLDCPVKEIKIVETNRTQMRCKVPFILPTDIEIVWRYAMEKTVLMDNFKEVTVGVDPLYFIPSARFEHSGTYQCEIFSQEHSLARIYYYLTGAHTPPLQKDGTIKLFAIREGSHYQISLSVVFTSVVPLAQLGHAELQEVFDQALLPGGQFPHLSQTVPVTLWLPSPVLLTMCLMSVLLLIFISLGVLCWLSCKTETSNYDTAQDKTYTEKIYLIHS